MLDTMWQLTVEYFPAREITLPTIDYYGQDLRYLDWTFVRFKYGFFYGRGEEGGGWPSPDELIEYACCLLDTGVCSHVDPSFQGNLLL